MDKLLSPTEQKREEYIQERLEAFTMAAMQGLCAMNNKSEEVFTSEDESWSFLGKTAVKIARATLTELSKQK